MLDKNVCLICEKGKIYESSRGWYKCSNCDADNNKLVDGILYPSFLFYYTPVIDFSVDRYVIGYSVKFLTIRKKEKSAVIIHVNTEDNRMIMKEKETGKIHFVIDDWEIHCGYNALFKENKVEFNGWWNKRIEII